MHVGQTNRLGHSKKTNKSSGKTGSGQRFEIPKTQEQAGAGTAQNVMSVGAVDALLAVQEIDQIGEERKKSIQDGSKILDLLEDLKIGLLAGQLSQSQIRHLEGAVERATVSVNDQRLADIMSAIILRAKVELAKLQR